MKKLSEQRLCRRSGHWLTAVLFGAVMILSSARGQSLTPGVDENTVAFWPFDEPEYVNMTLTDASPNHYDLRLRLGGRLTPGKYGNALQILGQELPACMYAEAGAQHMVPDITTRAVDAPTNILQTLAGPDWTWEFWLKLEQTPQTEVALMHLAVPSDPDDDHLNRLYMALTPSAGAGSAARLGYERQRHASEGADLQIHHRRRMASSGDHQIGAADGLSSVRGWRSAIHSSNDPPRCSRPGSGKYRLQQWADRYQL